MSQLELKELAGRIQGMLEAAAQLVDDAPAGDDLQAVIDRGEFRPSENETIGYWFARFLTIRECLWQVIDDVLAALDGKPTPQDGDLRHFVLGYAAVCQLVAIDRKLLFDVARHSVVQRKLNEPFHELRIARKQFTRVFEAFVDEKNALSLLNAMNFAKRHRKQMLALRSDTDVGSVASKVPQLEGALDPSKREYLRGAWSYVSHKWRRRGIVSANNVLSSVVEGVGRVASDIYITENKRVTDDIRREIAELLEPGDLLVTRHAIALTNLFMPGFWPHAALYVGTPLQRDALGVSVPNDKQPLWTGEICTLEALKDGVRLRALANTLAVDSVVVLRPRADAATISHAIERGLVHEGKLYNFDFDFFSADRLVCTEVIYRAYDGLDGIHFPLRERAGRKTLSAEDILNFALDSGTFAPLAIYGVQGCDTELVSGEGVKPLLLASLGADVADVSRS